MLALLVFIIILSFLVFIHELGHFVVAKKTGMRVDEFGFGFPPRAFRIAKKGDTEYTINWIPFGGFVKIYGENGEGEGASNSFGAKKMWQKIAVLVAGVVMNIVGAFFLLWVGFMVGLPHLSEIKELTISSLVELPDSPARATSLEEGDKIVGIVGHDFRYPRDLSTAVRGSNGKPLTFLIIPKNTNTTQNYTITPRYYDEIEGEKFENYSIGVRTQVTSLVRENVASSFTKAFSETYRLLWAIVRGLADLFVNIFSGDLRDVDVAGPIGIGVMTGEALSDGVGYLLELTILLSLNLAVINILPIPALDGGRIFFILLQKLFRNRIKKDTEAIIHGISFIFLIALMLAVTGSEIVSYWGMFTDWLTGG